MHSTSTIEIEVVGTTKESQVRRRIDTGFTGYVCIPDKGREAARTRVSENNDGCVLRTGTGNWSVCFSRGKCELLGRLSCSFPDLRFERNEVV